MLAAIGLERHERLERRRKLVAGTQLATILIVVAVGIAGRRAVRECRIAVSDAIERYLAADFEPVELVPDARRATGLKHGRQIDDRREFVRTAGIFRRQVEPLFEIDMRQMRDVDAAVDPGRKRWLIERGIFGIGGVAAAQIGGEFVPTSPTSPAIPARRHIAASRVL